METIHPIDKYIAEKLREYRQAREKTQQEVAQAVGISYQQLQKYESQQNSVPIRRLYKIAEYLAIPVTRFLPPSAAQRSDSPLPAGIETKEWDIIRRAYSKISDPEQRRKVQAIIKLYARDNRFCNPQ